MSIDISQYERSLEVRPLRLDDYDAVRTLQLACFPKMDPWDKDQYRALVTRFPEGQLAVEVDGVIAASSSSLIVDYAEYSDWHNWHTVSDGGYIRNHDEDGDTLYGIEIMVHPDHRGMKLARRLYDARKQVCRDRNLARMMIGGRIPGYVQHKDEMSAARYVERVQSKSLFDPVLTAQLANGFLLRQLVPDYMPSDEDSAGYATVMEWPNLDYERRPTPRLRRAVHPVRIGLAQYEMREVGRWEDFERQCRVLVEIASDNKTDFAVFPELFTLQLLCLIGRTEPGSAARRLAEFTPKYIEFFRNLAMEYDINIVGGSTFAMSGDRLMNIAYLFHRDGGIDEQAKIHVTPNERRWWGVEGGDRVDVFDTDHGRVAILICYDVEFPELVRIAVAKGARLLFVPYNTNDRYGHLRVRYCAQARCIENHLFIAASGCVGNLPFIENADVHYAQSALLTPSDITFSRDGIATEAQPNLETLVVQDVDLELLRRHRSLGTVQNWNDRRTDLYAVHWRDDPKGEPSGSV
ncbi:MAG TPA: GNAT family N-acetyltransferase [Polyangiaceae bacterium LLY-WYZ-14_1]|nr:GNAT family N-acetyltransferase [Polyangiaceae bacterium LLY-WYZ-14_1]